jgi:hypothetical protein
MKRRISHIIVLILLAQVTYAQSYSFKVLVSKGKAEVKAANTWEPLKVGAILKSTDEVKVAENSYLGLVDAKGKPLEIREARVYKVTELLQRVGPGLSVMSKYTDFILSSDKEKKGRLTATGAVHRGFKDVILVYLPGSERAELFGDKVGIQWLSEEVTGPFEVVFTSLLEEVLARFETSESQIIVDMNSGNLKGNYEVLVKVVSKANRGNGSKDYIIKKMRPADREKFAKSWEEIKTGTQEETALNKYILAGYFEETLLIVDALTAYQEAIKLAPDVALYKDAYNEFLKRLGFEMN